MFKSIDKFFILGRSGCGKSFLGKSIQQSFNRKIVIDSLHEYNGGDFDFVVDTYKSLIACMLAVQNQSKFSILFRFNLNLDEESQIQEFNKICEAVYNFGNVLLVVEEVHLYSSPQFLPHWLKNLTLMGRHKEVALLFTTQRAGETNKTLLAMSTHVFCGQMIDKNDQNYVASFIGKNSADLARLPDRTFFHFKSSDPLAVKTILNDNFKTGLDFKKKSTVNKKAEKKTSNKGK